MNPPNYFADDVNLFLYSKIVPQKEFTAGITKILLHAIPWTLLLRFAKWWKGSSRGKISISPGLMAVPEMLVCNTHGPAPWVSCMTARGEEEAGGKRESAMCSQTLRGAAVGAVWHGSNVRTTKVRKGQSEGAGMTTAPAGRAARSRPSHSNLLHLRRRKLPPRPGRWKGSASTPRARSFTVSR